MSRTDRQEQRALALLSRPVLRDARAEVIRIYESDRNARLPGALERIPQAASELVFASLLEAVNEDCVQPVFIRSLAPAHEGSSGPVPGSRWGIDNPDNIYRLAAIAPAAHYRLRGRFAAQPAADFSLSLHEHKFGEGGVGKTLAFFDRDALEVDADGGFELSLGPESADGRRSHLDSRGGVEIFVRDSLGDWLRETPVELSIEQVAGPQPAPRTDEAVATRAAALAVMRAHSFLQLIQHGLFERGETNNVIPPSASGQSGGLVSQLAAQGHYRLAGDEALIVTVDLMGAHYFGFQLADPWMVSYEYANRLASLNHVEAQADADGRLRFVIATHDPGVHNWLDSGGHLCGTTTLRWQRLPANARTATEPVQSRVVRVGELRTALPPETRWLTPPEREAQRVRRAQGYMRRWTWRLPPEVPPGLELPL
jgi:hypothetical protein